MAPNYDVMCQRRILIKIMQSIETKCFFTSFIIHFLVLLKKGQKSSFKAREIRQVMGIALYGRNMNSNVNLEM